MERVASPPDSSKIMGEYCRAAVRSQGDAPSFRPSPSFGLCGNNRGDRDRMRKLVLQCSRRGFGYKGHGTVTSRSPLLWLQGPWDGSGDHPSVLPMFVSDSPSLHPRSLPGSEASSVHMLQKEAPMMSGQSPRRPRAAGRSITSASQSLVWPKPGTC